jgi:hypothetical protein
MPKVPTEIIAIMERGDGPPVLAEYGIQRLEQQWTSAGEAAAPLMDFIPIRLVTILEDVIRGAVVQAVNHGDPYASRGISLIARWPSKLVADALLAIKDERLTLGDLVSHGFSTGRVDEIIATLRVVFGDRFREELASTTTYWTEDKGKDLAPIISNIDLTLATVDRLLQVRHIVVHETPRKPPYSKADLSDFFLYAAQFASALGWFCTGRVHGTVPMGGIRCECLQRLR